MQVDVIVVLLIVVFGCAAFLFGVFYLVCQAVGAVWRGAVGLIRPGGGVSRTAAARPERVCPRPECRKVEHRQARFCSQCGAALADPPGKA